MFASGSISEIALIFLTREDFSRQAERALAVIGRELAVSRCSIFMDPDDGVISVSRGLWRADGIDGDIPDRWYSACADIFMNEDLCGSAGVCAISDVKSIPSGSGRELESMGVRSLLAAPIIVDGVIHGFLGAEECSEPREWKETEMETLKTAAVIITAAYSRLLLSGRLSVSEENFRGFFNTISDIILIADTEGRLIYANAGACAKLGFSLSELGGWPLIELCPFEKKDGMRLAMNEAMLHRKVGNYQSELNVRSGGRIPVDTLIWAGRWDNRECLFSLSRDLSAEHSALQKFERLFRGNPAAMALLVSTDRVFSDVNESFVEKFGYSRDEVIGRSGYSLGIFIYDDRFLRMEDELTRSGRIRNRELTFRHRDGRNIHALFYGETFKNGGEEYLLAVMVDVTDQVHLQMTLESEQRRLANIIEGGGLGTWEWDIQSGRIVFNERWAASMGYKLDELRPIDMDKCASLIHPDDFAESMKRINRHLRGRAISTSTRSACGTATVHGYGP
jgi:PAS domain S-box-containing protein